MKIIIDPRMPSLKSPLQQRDAVVRSGAVDQRVDPVPLLVHPLNQPGSGLGVGNIALNSPPFPAFLLHDIDTLFGFLGAGAVAYCPPPVVSREIQRDGAADTLGAAGDQRDFLIVVCVGWGRG